MKIPGIVRLKSKRELLDDLTAVVERHLPTSGATDEVIDSEAVLAVVATLLSLAVTTWISINRASGQGTRRDVFHKLCDGYLDSYEKAYEEQADKPVPPRRR